MTTNLTKTDWTTAEVLGKLQANFKGKIIREGEPGYDEARHIFNGMVNRRPAVFAQCTDTDDVVAAVRFARAHNVPVSVKGGGHNVAGTALVEGGLVIDLTLMRKVDVDPVTKTARAQGGATWAEYDAATQAHGLASTGGLISSTGVAGLTLGGGLGWLMRKYGMAVDNLKAVEMVNADGEIIRASETENPDLFWAMQGAGHNFGVVTTLEFNLHEVGTMLAGMVVYPIDQAREVLRHYRDYTMSAPDEVIANAAMMHSPEGDRIVAVLMLYVGPVEEGEKALQPLRSFGNPVADTVAPMEYTALQSMLNDGFPFGLQVYWKSSFLKELTDETIDAAIAQYANVTSPLSVALLEQFGGAVSRVDPRATAFRHRDATYNFVIITRWEEGDPQPHIAWARSLWDAVQPWASGGIYVNYLGSDEQETVEAAYGDDLERVAALKAKYDPSNFFRVNQNVSPR